MTNYLQKDNKDADLYTSLVMDKLRDMYGDEVMANGIDTVLDPMGGLFNACMNLINSGKSKEAWLTLANKLNEKRNLEVDKILSNLAEQEKPVLTKGDILTFIKSAK